MTEKYIVVYGKVMEDKENGIFFDYPFFGGEVSTLAEAETKAKEIVNDKTRQAIVIPHIFLQKEDETIEDIMKAAKKRFSKMGADIYDCEDIYERRNKTKA